VTVLPSLLRWLAVARCWWLGDLGASSAGSGGAGNCRVTAG